MNEQVWTTFKTVAELSAISKAARHLNLSQSAVSQQIHQLESAYGTTLFLRTSQGVQLTEAGEVLYRFVSTILKTMDESRQALNELKAHQPSTLTIGASLTIAEYILPKLLSRYLTFPSSARISVMMANSRAIFDQVRHGEVDIGLIEANLFDPQLIVRPFLDDRPCAVIPHFHPWAGRQEVTLPEFLEQPLILREPGSGTRQALEESLNHIGVDLQSLNVRLVLATTQAIKSMIISGLGISILSPFTIHSTETHLLQPIRVRGLNLYRNFYVAHRRDLNLRLAHHFVQTLLQSRFSAITGEPQP